MTVYARMAVLIALAVALCGWTWKAYSLGANKVLAQWTAQKLIDSEAARLREKALQISNERLDRDYQTKKSALAVAAVANAGKLRDLQAVITASINTSTPSGDNADPRLDIIAECASAATNLDSKVKELAGQTIALQGYAREVCLAK